MANRSLLLIGRGRSHLASVGETYFQHMRFALGVGCLLVFAGLACLIHAVLPGMFETRASRAVARLHAAFERRSAVEPDFLARSDAGGLLVLLLLSIGVALMPWLGRAHTAVATSMSLLALGVPAAALRASAQGDSDEYDDLWAPPRPAAAPRREIEADVAIVGAGFSGTMLAAQLARAEGLRVALIERRDLPARGLAYSTGHPNHLLNVRAGRMSAWPDDPGHFARWLGERRLGGPFDFVPRRTYGAYLEEQLAGAKAGAGEGLSLVSGTAIDVCQGAVVLEDGQRIAADTIVLALGNLPKQPPAMVAALELGVYRPDPWSDDLAEGLGAEDTVLLLGTGLTMIDTAVALADAGFAGRIVAASRRGLMPRAHEEAPAAGGAPLCSPGQPLTRQLRAVRAQAEAAGWRAAIDALRPVTNALWEGADAETRARFLRHLRPWWDVHRHRVAPAIADRLRVLDVSGRLSIRAASLVSAEPSERGAQVELRLRGSTYRDRLDVARIVDCTGPESDIARSGEPLLRNLLARGLVRREANGLGFDTGAGGALLGADGTPTPGLFAVGPLTRGRAFEMSAVPELRGQAAAMAKALETRFESARPA